MSERWKEIKKKYWPPGKDQLLILILLGLLLAVIAVPVKSGQEEAAGSEENMVQEMPASSEEDYCSRLEARLEALLVQVEGVGRVQVMLTLEGSRERRVEKDRTFSEQGNEEETVYEELSGRERIPYVTLEINPKVEGVLVIAEGGGNSRIRQEILEAAQALFGIDAHKIKIMKMEGTK